MIEDLLDVSRVIMGKAHLEFERLDLAQLCRARSPRGARAGASRTASLSSTHTP